MFKTIPAIDILDGKVVRLTQGDYSKVDYYDFTPVELAKKYEDAGITRIHLVDLNGAKDGQLVNLKVFQSIRQNVSCELELGGGIRTIEHAKTLFEVGIDFIILGSLLVKNPPLSEQIIKTFPNKIIAGLDIKNNQIATEGWIKTSEKPLQSILNWLEDLPIESIICTHISRDGMMNGPDFIGLENLAKQTKIPLIASGGVSSINDIQKLKNNAHTTIVGCIIGKAILNNTISMSELAEAI